MKFKSKILNYTIGRLFRASAKYLKLDYFYNTSNIIIKILTIIVIPLIIYGLIAGLFIAPSDEIQGDGFRIIYVHVPAAFLSLFVYINLAIFSGIYLIWRIKLFDILAKASASIGAVFTFIALVTGSIWGKPMWGTWWIWDARLTSELILLFLYWGYIAIRQSIPNEKSAAKTAAFIAILGIINVPIVHFSVDWWFTLHQGSTISNITNIKIASSMAYPLLAMICSFVLLYFIIVLLKAKQIILDKKLIKLNLV